MDYHDQKSNQDIAAIRIRLASPEEILTWSKGEVIKPETINYRTQKPEKDGLFSERIFGPVKDWECSCGKYKKVRHKGIVCDRCGVEVTRSSVRRERMGHINLASPCAHIWFLRSIPSRIGLVLDMPLPALERVIYYASWVVIRVNEETKSKFLEKLKKVFDTKLKSSRKLPKEEKKKTEEALRLSQEEITSLYPGRILTETEFLRIERAYPGVAEIGIGAEAIQKMLKLFDLAKVETELRKSLLDATGLARHKIMARLRLVRALLVGGVRPEWMIMSAIPVLPPELRPMVALDGGRYASSDLNDLYRRVINRNNRLKRLLDLKAPEVIVRNERRMLQEAVDALLDNSMRHGGGTSMLGAARRPLRSLADILRGKTGRFRQNLLGKRVDYSGRSVIVVGPELKLSQCGIPKKMALELFKPFVMRKLIEKELAHNIRGAARLIDEASEAVWAVLDEVIEDAYVLLNRAPTLHRLGIQAFRPKLIEGLAIQLHPLVCEAYNADFDGDQMAVHVPLSQEAQQEARVLMSSLHNLWKPATGNSIIGPFRDIVVGLYWLTTIRPGAKGEGKIFASPEEALLARDSGQIDFRAGVRIPREYLTLFEPMAGKDKKESSKDKDILETTTFVTSAGRMLLRRRLPKEVLLANKEIDSKRLRLLVERIVETLKEPERIEAALDALKALGFWASSISGISWGMDDLVVPEKKAVLLKEAHAAIRELERDVERGLMTGDEKRSRAIEIWSNLKTKVEEAARLTLDPYGPILPIVTSGARGSWAQLVQVVGMKGLVANPKGEVIELPILSSFIEGLNVLEYFISTHGARKGTADTALKTAAAGYLTRRLVEAGQEIIITEEDCADTKGVEISRSHSEALNVAFWFRLFSRYLAEPIKTPQGKLIAHKGELVSREKAHEIEKAGCYSVRVRSPFSCKSLRGICVKCYGMDLGRLEPVDLGTAVGIIAAQSIGEPGTQLTMRTFHIGGVAGAGDITAGLPRVEELFEARTPKNPAILAPFDAEVVSVETSDAGSAIKFQAKNKAKKTSAVTLTLEPGVLARVKSGDVVSAGDAISEGSVDPKDLFRFSSRERAARYLHDEVLRTYASQGVSIHDKHIEVIVRQMFSRIRITDAGDSRFIGDEVVSHADFERECARLQKVRKSRPPKGDGLLLGITRVALSTSSVLAAASFQETTRVLVVAALEGREDRLEGLKENIIIGRLIPAGMGWKAPVD